jgi:transposase
MLLRVSGRVQKHQRRFGTMTQELKELASWLREFGVTQVAMESSGVYWKPVWNILEGQFAMLLANAQHIKNVPGRKTDQKDAEWIAQLLQHGLLRPSYIPNEVIRDLRDLTRMRASMSQEASRISNRIQKVLEDANLKLASVATNALGKSGRAMLEEICRSRRSGTPGLARFGPSPCEDSTTQAGSRGKDSLPSSLSASTVIESIRFCGE